MQRWEIVTIGNAEIGEKAKTFVGFKSDSDSLQENLETLILGRNAPGKNFFDPSHHKLLSWRH